ncbi:MAG TPA: amidohydrolase family protein [archaeon]|nr:amidohydrolase family protein [archaeon]
MDRRDFVKMGVLGLAGAGAEKEKSSAGPRDMEEEALPENLNHSSGNCPRVLFHCHCFPRNPERFPLDPKTGFFPGSIEHLCTFIARLGFDCATALSPFEVPPGRCTSRIDPDKDGLAWLEEQAAGRRQIMLFASLNPQMKNSPERLVKARQQGFIGVKFHPPICRFSIDPERDQEFYSLLNSYRMPLLIHTGVFSSDFPFPLAEYHPLKIDRLANRFPEIPIIFAHGAGLAFCREVFAVLQANPNTYLDLTHSLDKKYSWYIPLSDMEVFFDHLGPSRVIYGVDYPWFGPDDFSRDLACLEKLGLDNKDLDLVLGGTFMKITGK